ncbi:MAG: Teichoic acids export ATP-binding protein TagH [Lentisphaerae bacterium ADurb.Bin242]|nr:MAG: Teichoic acids export ATP-binding protein TagH [Lentisphaerae bacterium ADurb.Bin242]
MSNQIIYDVSHIGMYYTKSATFPWRKNRFQALKDINFKVEAGDIIGVIGQNGAGKSTLLRLLAGILEPDNGHIYRAYDNIGILSFGAGFEDRLTGRQNIMLEGVQMGISRSVVYSILDAIVELAGIGDFINQPVKVYSTGMRTRLGFAIAYYLHTNALLIDEVFVAGDEKFQKKAGQLITEKIQSGITVVMVSHALNVLEQLCNRIIHIDNGVSLPELPVKESIQRYVATA